MRAFIVMLLATAACHSNTSQNKPGNYTPQHQSGECLQPQASTRHNYLENSYYKILDVRSGEYLQSAWLGHSWSAAVWFSAHYMDKTWEAAPCPDKSRD